MKFVQMFQRMMLAGCVSMLGSACTRGQQEEPRLDKAPAAHVMQVLGTNSLEIGNLRNYVVTNVPFRVVNRGEAPIRIEKLVPTCSCISGTAATNVIAPNGEAVINVHLNPKTVHGVFDRSLWVYTDEPDSPYLLLALRGTVVPLFTGLPPAPIVLKYAQPGLPVTNHLALVATEPNVFLGTPEIVTKGDLSVTVNIVTNQKETADYAITLVATPLGGGSLSAVVQLPIIGQPLASPLVIRLQSVVGGELVVTPNQIGLASGSKAQTFQLVIRGTAAKMNPAQLAWDPKPEGVQITSRLGSRGNSLHVSIEVSPKAAAALLQEKGPSIHFTYPNHKPTNVFFVSETQAGAAGRGSRHRRGPMKKTF
ncbi:MAG: DUF1573 domain-containing protein [bacterium]